MRKVIIYKVEGDYPLRIEFWDGDRLLEVRESKKGFFRTYILAFIGL